RNAWRRSFPASHRCSLQCCFHHQNGKQVYRPGLRRLEARRVVVGGFGTFVHDGTEGQMVVAAFDPDPRFYWQARDGRRPQAARRKARRKGQSPLFKEVELTTFNEGQCVQMLHAGPYDREPETIRQMEPSPPGKATVLTACTTRFTCPIRAAWRRKSCGPFCAFPSNK